MSDSSPCHGRARQRRFTSKRLLLITLVAILSSKSGSINHIMCVLLHEASSHHCFIFAFCVAEALARCADPIIAVLEDETMDFPERDLYIKDMKDQWTRPATSGPGLERYCRTCQIWRPPRSSHCNKCGFCVVRTSLLLFLNPPGSHPPQNSHTKTRFNQVGKACECCMMLHRGF